MNIADLWAEIEREQDWREAEMRFLRNLLISIPEEKSDDRDRFRRSLILMLYAHFEGFCKFALLLYLRAVNNEGLSCKDVQPAIAAASMSNILAALRDPSSKCKEFTNDLPDDAKLHLFAREREFVSRFDDFLSRTVAIPESTIDLESNLKPVVLRKNLFRLGFPHDEFNDLEGSIHRLLNLRNDIAHGKASLGITSETYSEVEAAVRDVINKIKRRIMEALRIQAFRTAGV